MAGLVGEQTAQGDPKIVWTVDDSGWIYEARITIPGRADYHGYPLLPGDAMATKVLNRFSLWVLGAMDDMREEDPAAHDALTAARERYRG